MEIVERKECFHVSRLVFLGDMLGEMKLVIPILVCSNALHKWPTYLNAMFNPTIVATSDCAKYAVAITETGGALTLTRSSHEPRRRVGMLVASVLKRRFQLGNGK